MTSAQVGGFTFLKAITTRLRGMIILTATTTLLGRLRIFAKISTFCGILTSPGNTLGDMPPWVRFFRDVRIRL